MDSDMGTEANSFRPAKRRKFLRTRLRNDEEDNVPREAPTAGGHEADNPSEESAGELAIKDIIRHRKANRTRRPGIEFSNTRPKAASESSDSKALTATAPEADVLNAISDRFTGHTGQIVDVDKHMVAYIEAEMAKRRLDNNLPSAQEVENHDEQLSDSYDEDDDEEDDHDNDTSSRPGLRFPQKQPASLGRIHEIDLGRDAALLNARRTEAAIRRRNGEAIPPDDKPVKVRRPRIGRDGKPMKPRPRKRRNSEDIKRDQLVEQVLKESRLEIYDAPDPKQDELDEVAADDRVAEQFRQSFIDAMQSRHRHRHSGQPKPPAGKGVEQTARGPKLGGSRSARAAMREAKEKAAAKK